MSYDLNFWKYSPGVYLEHQELYERLSKGVVVEGLERLPVAQIRERIAAAFKDWERIGDHDWEQEGKGAFRVFTTSQFIQIGCYGMEGAEMNKFIDILYEYECPLYDPQVARRFDGVHQAR
jgi:hypothetical protein